MGHYQWNLVESKSIIVVDLKFIADVEIIVKAIVVLIDYSHAAIGRWNLQGFQQMPFGTAKVV